MVLISISSPFLVLYCPKYKLPENMSGMLLFFAALKILVLTGEGGWSSRGRG
jgi:hypothetical protein